MHAQLGKSLSAPKWAGQPPKSRYRTMKSKFQVTAFTGQVGRILPELPTTPFPGLK